MYYKNIVIRYSAKPFELFQNLSKTFKTFQNLFTTLPATNDRLPIHCKWLCHLHFPSVELTGDVCDNIIIEACLFHWVIIGHFKPTFPTKSLSAKNTRKIIPNSHLKKNLTSDLEQIRQSQHSENRVPAEPLCLIPSLDLRIHRNHATLKHDI